MELCTKDCKHCDPHGETINFAKTADMFYCPKIGSAWSIYRYAHVFPVICKHKEAKDEQD